MNVLSFVGWWCYQRVNRVKISGQRVLYRIFQQGNGQEANTEVKQSAVYASHQRKKNRQGTGKEQAGGQVVIGHEEKCSSSTRSPEPIIITDQPQPEQRANRAMSSGFQRTTGRGSLTGSAGQGSLDFRLVCVAPCQHSSRAIQLPPPMFRFVSGGREAGTLRHRGGQYNASTLVSFLPQLYTTSLEWSDVTEACVSPLRPAGYSSPIPPPALFCAGREGRTRWLMKPEGMQ